MARKPLRPLIRSGGFYPSRKWTPLVYAGGYTTANGGEEPAPPPIEKTVTGNPIHITDALAKPVQALSVKLEPVQAGSGDPSPDNVRPISGHTDADVTRTGKNLLPNISGPRSEGSVFIGQADEATYPTHLKAGVTYAISFTTNLQQAFVYMKENGGSNILFGISGDTYTPTSDMDVQMWVYNSGLTSVSNFQLELGSSATTYEPYQGNTYTIQLGDTVYGGTLDVTQGKLTVDRAMVDLGTLNWFIDSKARFQSPTPAVQGIKPASSASVVANILCSNYKTISSNGTYLQNIGISLDSSGTCHVYDPSFSDAATFKAAMSGVQLVYELATSQTIQLTPTQVELLLGENNLFSDGEMTLVYLADGNASDVEALNILLGGRYTNTHGEDEPTDREALDIVLGGKK